VHHLRASCNVFVVFLLGPMRIADFVYWFAFVRTEWNEGCMLVFHIHRRVAFCCDGDDTMSVCVA
jgi:hypothetical protein